MKTRFILLAAITAFLALTHVAVPADAQHRSYKNEAEKHKIQQRKDTRKAKTGSTVRSEESKTKSRQNSSGVRRSSARGSQAHPLTRKSAPAVNQRSGSAANDRKVYKEKQPQQNPNPASVRRRNPETNRSNLRNAPGRNQRESFRSNGSARNNNPKGGAVSARAHKEHNRTIYKVSTRDSRYKPSKNYKGNNNHWKAGFAKTHIHYIRHNEDYYRKYDHRKHLHWDHHWETYRWNINSWRDYYSGYHPYSYRFNKHYFYHPVYGHVIKRFGYKPDYFVHNHIRYYNYNGHFFRHFPGVGYVLVDMPFGLDFENLPRSTERVYINGFLYFRVGNLFFEKSPYGFALIHYPERYFALDKNYYNDGYYREVDFYIHR